jgi:nucleoid DNA-binding protein
VISPLLANMFLHYALDQWVDEWRRTRARGDVIIVRYAADFVMGFQYEKEAKEFLDALRERLREFHLELHPDKTRLIEFGRFAERDRSQRGQGKPETFDFLGFTHWCSTTRKTGKFILALQRYIFFARCLYEGALMCVRKGDVEMQEILGDGLRDCEEIAGVQYRWLQPVGEQLQSRYHRAPAKASGTPAPNSFTTSETSISPSISFIPVSPFLTHISSQYHSENVAL